MANDYRRLNDGVYVYKTQDYGKSWQRLVDNKDVGSFALSIVEDPVTDQLLFLGTDDGLYYSLDAGTQWTKWKHGFPTVPVSDLLIHHREHDLVIATFGRSLWIMDDIRPLRALAQDQSTIAKPLHLFEPPQGYQAAYQQPTGSRFGADALFQGQNRPSGVALSYWVNNEEVKKISKHTTDSTNGKKTKDSLFLKIYQGDKLVRTLQKEIPEEHGIYHWRWYMDAKGGPWIRRNPRESKQESGGGYLSPGIYEAELSMGNNDETKYQCTRQKITINPDPRIKGISTQGAEKAMAMMDKAQSLSEEINGILSKIKSDKEGLERLKKDLKLQEDEDHQALLNEIKELDKALTELQDLYVGKQDERQGITAEAAPSVADRIRQHYSYLRSRPDGPTQTEIQLWQHTQEAAAEAQQKVNEFYNTTWKAFTQKISEVTIPYFKPAQ